jgi:hypothetical protein
MKRFDIRFLVFASVFSLACSGENASPESGQPAGGLSELSDSFEAESLDPAWSVFNPEVVDVEVADGALSLDMKKSALWYQAGRGTLLEKRVSGNFMVTATVHAQKASDASAMPASPVQLGGLMARDPMGTDQGGEENYVFIVVGHDEDDISVETKSTTDSVSDYEGPSWPSAEAELRMCRVGATFQLYKRELGATTWELAKSYERPDLPEELQVGPNAYTAIDPDLRVSFDDVTFADVADLADCAH